MTDPGRAGHVGLDAGSVSVKYALIDERGNVIGTEYIRHKGDPLGVARRILEGLPPDVSLSLTGSAGKMIAEAMGIEPVNEVVALAHAVRRLLPDVRTVIEMGGEDSKLLIIDGGDLKEFAMNSVCAAGTGSFLDQQAERLYLGIEEFGEMALRSEKPPRIAGRCSVFAKSDMIHLQQIATPVEDIVAGLCFAVARNFKGSICRNMELPEPVCFVGGVAANRGVVRAFREVLGVDGLIVPGHHAVMPAIGAALKDMESGSIRRKIDPAALDEYISACGADGASHERLCDDRDAFLARHRVSYDLHRPPGDEKIDAYLGIDIGSISTNLALIDGQGRLLAKRYLMTAGRPIEAVKKGLEEIGREAGDFVNIRGVGTTGSGRYMIADFVGADIVKNEITAQARAAVEIDPGVDTILEIGGQDSKYISIRDGIIVDFEMNKACAAGTGSFLEEQAEKLGISIRNDFSELAFRSGAPCVLGERCTVFMENSLLSRRQKGAPKEDLVAGLAYSIVQNYVNRVVAGRPIGNRVFFQGGVAFNKTVVAAFENYLGKKITVPPHHDVTGAIGMALIAREHAGNGHAGVKSAFKGFDLSRRNYSVNSFECKSCDNHCEINRVKVEGEDEPLYYGSRCEKYDVKRRQTKNGVPKMPDLFAERSAMLTRTHEEYAERYANGTGSNSSSGRPRIGVPRIFFFHDFLPYWSTLLWELGFEVVLSDRTNRRIVNLGIENILAESCFPHKVAHGHIKDLIEKGVDAIFLPSFINFNPESSRVGSFACPYAQTMPYIARKAFPDVRIASPIVNYERGTKYLTGQICEALSGFGIKKNGVREALRKAELAQKDFLSAVRKRGMEVLAELPERAIVIVGRAYNAFDSGINLEIPRKLAWLGEFSIPMDFLPLDAVDISEKWTNMYWRSGQNILKAAEIIRENPNLYALFIGNFSCGPDSFIQHYFGKSMEGKPYLLIEIDEHSADAGVITRCEAFLDSIGGGRKPSSSVRIQRRVSDIRNGKKKKIVYIPRMSDHAFGIAAAFEMCGLDAEVMPEPDEESVRIGRRHVSGKECYPCAITTGDMVRKTMASDFDPDRAVFFMPSGAGPCRFGQYNVFQRMVLDELGLSQVPIYAPNQDGSFYTELGIVGKDFTRNAWKGIMAIEMLTKCLHETRPYEKNRGETDRVYSECLSGIGPVIKNSNGKMPEYLRDMRDAFSSIPRIDRKRPLIGIIGEIFVRQNKFANEQIIRKVEKFGGEVWLAPIEEWLYYINFTGLRKSLVKLKKNYLSSATLKDITRTVITRRVQKKIEREFAGHFDGFLRTLHEPETREILRQAAPYLHDSFEGEAILSMGKSVDLIRRGASGIISTMPFGCMPGTIVSALMKGLKEDSGVPCLSVAFDGSEATCSEIQLEAFMHQAKERFEKTAYQARP
jgi:predicted CoA-substrate-specific enzyme activase